MTLCDDCRAAIHRWEDTKPSTHGHRAGGIKFISHSTRDDTPAGVRDNRAIRWQVWRDLVVSQIALIRDICAAQHQPGQTELFKVDEVAA